MQLESTAPYWFTYTLVHILLCDHDHVRENKTKAKSETYEQVHRVSRWRRRCRFCIRTERGFSLDIQPLQAKSSNL